MLWLQISVAMETSDWAKGSSYSLSDYVYDLTRLLRSVSVHKTAIVGHSMRGMIGLMYAGTYPDRVERLAILDGVTVFPGSQRAPIHEQIADWVAQLDRIAERQIRHYRSISEAAERIFAHNKRLTSDCGLHGGCSSRSAQTTIQGARISSHLHSLGGYDEPEILRSSSR